MTTTEQRQVVAFDELQAEQTIAMGAMRANGAVNRFMKFENTYDMCVYQSQTGLPLAPECAATVTRIQDLECDSRSG